jgi:hypothetical protein
MRELIKTLASKKVGTKAVATSYCDVFDIGPVVPQVIQRGLKPEEAQTIAHRAAKAGKTVSIVEVETIVRVRNVIHP